MATLGVIIGNRGFFSDYLCETGREEILEVLKAEGIDAVVLSPDDSKFGSVESLEDAHKCGDLFKKHQDDIDGILVTLPNFGDERGVANAIRFSGLDVPVLVHGFSDTIEKMGARADRRDSFCGKISVCNNLYQYGIKFTLTSLHTQAPDSESFRSDLRQFMATCNVVGSARGARLGQIGARPAAFATVRYSEKLLERTGISVETLDLSELLGWVHRLADDDPIVISKHEEMAAYTDTSSVPAVPLLKMAKLGATIDKWMDDNGLQATAIQCWTAIEEFFGVVPCTCMSMMSNKLMASACEADIAGTMSMYVLSCASERPAALLDWNNNYGEDPDMGMVFHCSNLPKDFFESHRMDYQHHLADSPIGRDNSYGTMAGRIASGPFTYCRISTDDINGVMRGYVGEGVFTDDTLETFGGYGIFRVDNLQGLLAYICRTGFEHHVAATRVPCAAAVDEALKNYMGWEMYHHGTGGGDAGQPPRE